MEVPPPVDEGMESNGEAAPAAASTSTDIESFLGLQQEALERFFSQQASILQKPGQTSVSLTEATPAAVSTPKRRRRDSEITLDTPADELGAELCSNNRELDDDPLSAYSKGHTGKGVVFSDESEEDSQRYQDLLDSTEEKMGSPLDTDLAGVCKQIWGKALSNVKNKEELQNILIPSNCTVMKTPRLNTEIYIKLNEGAQNKDRSAQAKQKESAKASVPILQAMVEVRKLERMVRKNMKKGKDDKEALQVVEKISPLLHTSLTVLNHTFSEGLRKRKSDVCTSLGRQFKPFATSGSTEELLFDDDAMRKMESDLKFLRTKTSEKKFGSGGFVHTASKTFKTPTSPRGVSNRAEATKTTIHTTGTTTTTTKTTTANNGSTKRKNPKVEVGICSIDISLLHDRVQNFMACNITNYVSQWCKVTSDKFIIDIVRHGLRINFTQEPPEREPFEYKRCKQDFLIIEMEVANLLSKGVISESPIESGDYFSNLFTTPKKDGTYRTILNLKYLNQECETSHFIKTGSTYGSAKLLFGIYWHQGCFLLCASSQCTQKILKFTWVGKAYHYNAMPNGYVDAMRVFTKILKPVFASLREQGYTSVVYVDDSLLYGLTNEECQTNVMVTLESL